MNVKIKWALFIHPLLLSACSSGESSRYKDLSQLEKPPVIIVAETSKKTPGKVDESVEKKGFGEFVSLAGPAELPVLKIKKTFDRSWDIIEQALNQQEIEITDKNRDKGVFYLKYDPDQRTDKDPGFLGNFSFFTTDDYEEARYRLTVLWRDTDTDVSVDLVGEDGKVLKNDLDYDEDFEGETDSGALLIKDLYKTIRDNLPVK